MSLEVCMCACVSGVSRGYTLVKNLGTTALEIRPEVDGTLNVNKEHCNWLMFTVL